MNSLLQSLGTFGLKAILGAGTVVVASSSALASILNKSSDTDKEVYSYSHINSAAFSVSDSNELIHLNIPQVSLSNKYISELSRRFTRLLDVNSENNDDWWRTLKANKNTLDLSTLNLYKKKCAQIFYTDLSKVTDSFRSANDGFVKVHCRRPELSSEKFKRHNINFVAAARSVNWNFEAPKNAHFWKRVTDFAKERKIGYVDQLKKYCEWFPKNNWTSNYDQLTPEEQDFKRYCR